MNYISNWIEQNIGISPDIQSKLLNSLIAILIIWIIYQVILRAVIYRIVDLRIRYRWMKSLGYIFFVIGILIVGPLWFNGVQSAATYFGLLTAGLAIALRDPITDVVGWIFLITRRQLNVGDRIQIGDYIGDVVDLGVFEFTLMEIGNWVEAEQSTGRLLHVPNAEIFTSVLANYSNGFTYIWNEIPVLLSFNSDWEKAKNILEDILHEQVELPESTVEDELRRLSNRYMVQYGKLTPIVYTSVKEDGILLTIRYLCEARQRRDSSQKIWESILKSFSQQPDIRFSKQTKPAENEPEKM
jgi:small-conductance mechanosensitive channel